MQCPGYFCDSKRFCYSQAPKSVTSFNLFTFFREDIIQSEDEDIFQLTSDWINLHERMCIN